MAKTPEERRENRRIRYWEDDEERATLLKKNREWYYKNREQHLALKKEKVRANKERAISYLGRKCFDCGREFHIAVLDFHHRDPKTKKRSITELVSNTFSNWQRVEEELDKCDLLCANCHRLRHHLGPLVFILRMRLQPGGTFYNAPEKD